MNTLKAEKRTMDTKAKRLRREGYVTGNVFGREMEGSLPVKIEKSAVEKLLKTNNKGSQIMLDVDGEVFDFDYVADFHVTDIYHNFVYQC